MSEADYLKRIAELEAQVEHDRIGKQLMQQTIMDLVRDTLPYDPPTPEEIEAMVNGPRGQPISEIIAEFEKELANG